MKMRILLKDDKKNYSPAVIYSFSDKSLKNIHVHLLNVTKLFSDEKIFKKRVLKILDKLINDNIILKYEVEFGREDIDNLESSIENQIRVWGEISYEKNNQWG